MRIGQMRSRLNIEQIQSSSRNEFGETAQAWAVYTTVWAAVEPLSGRNLALAQAKTITNTATHKVTMRYLNGIDVKSMRFAMVNPNGFALETLTTQQYLDLTAPQYQQLPGTTYVYFAINEMLNPDMAQNWLTFSVTQVITQ